MRLTTVREGDIVAVDLRGRRFHAIVAGRNGTRLAIRPIERGNNYGTVTARQVTSHWSKRRRTLPRADH
jgi:hypothetical protein